MIKDICEDLKAVIPLVVKMFVSTIKFHKSFKFMPNIASPLFYFFCCCFCCCFFSIRLLSVLRGHSVFSSLPMTSDFEGFSIPDFIHYIYISYLNSWERASIFPFECSVLNKDTIATIFITSLVWRGPWLGIEPVPPALEASTIPLGYRGGGVLNKWHSYA